MNIEILVFLGGYIHEAQTVQYLQMKYSLSCFRKISSISNQKDIVFQAGRR